MRLLDRRENKRLAAAYRRSLDGEAGRIVLADLARFCRAREAPFVAGDAMATGVLIGRQEVFHRLTRYMHLSEAEVWQLIGGNPRPG